ncbi:DUF2029 domain-containing protein [bacterium]|nr:DUF2029 domain-containing protein [candidate division CSSED10-310 bacterium]
MISRRMAQVVLFMAAIAHGIMLANLARHFTWSGGELVPIRTGSRPPAHWNRGHRSSGPLSRPGTHRFEQKLRELKAHEIRTRQLISVPPRQTDNFGLDLWVRDANRTDPGGDFFQIIYAGTALRKGLNIYENDSSEADTRRATILKRTVPFHPPNRYPPGFIYTAGWALSFLSPWNAYLFWTVLHEFALFGCIWITWRMSRYTPQVFILSAVMWLAFTPWYLELYMGQTTFLIMTGTFVLGAWWAGEGSRSRAGLWWMLTLLVKPLTLLYASLLVRLKQWRVLAWGLGIPVLSVAIYFSVYPADAPVFFGWASGREMVSSLGNLCFQNLVFHFCFSDRVALGIALAALVTGLYFTFLHKPFNPIRVLCIWVTVYFLGYTHVWEHHQVLLLSALVLAFTATKKSRFLLPWLLAAVPSPFYFFEGHWNWIREIVYLGSGTLPVLIFLFLLMVTRFKSRRETGTVP